MSPDVNHTGSKPEEALAGHQWDLEGFLLHLWPGGVAQAGGEQGGPEQAAPLRAQGKGQHAVHREERPLTGWDMLIECLDAMLLRDLDERAKTQATPTED